MSEREMSEMEITGSMMVIMMELGRTDIMTQLAEEAAELAAAASKMVRKMVGENPTPKTIEECREDLLEEIADVQVCITAARHIFGASWYDIEKIKEKKIKRWAERIVEVNKTLAGDTDWGEEGEDNA